MIYLFPKAENRCKTQQADRKFKYFRRRLICTNIQEGHIVELKAPNVTSRHIWLGLKHENVQDKTRTTSNRLKAVLEERKMDCSVLIWEIFLVDLWYGLSILQNNIKQTLGRYLFLPVLWFSLQFPNDQSMTSMLIAVVCLYLTTDFIPGLHGHHTNYSDLLPRSFWKDKETVPAVPTEHCDSFQQQSIQVFLAKESGHILRL